MSNRFIGFYFSFFFIIISSLNLIIFYYFLYKLSNNNSVNIWLATFYSIPIFGRMIISPITSLLVEKYLKKTYINKLFHLLSILFFCLTISLFFFPDIYSNNKTAFLLLLTITILFHIKASITFHFRYFFAEHLIIKLKTYILIVNLSQRAIIIIAPIIAIWFLNITLAIQILMLAISICMIFLSFFYEKKIFHKAANFFNQKCVNLNQNREKNNYVKKKLFIFNFITMTTFNLIFGSVGLILIKISKDNANYLNELIIFYFGFLISFIYIQISNFKENLKKIFYYNFVLSLCLISLLYFSKLTFIVYLVFGLSGYVYGFYIITTQTLTLKIIHGKYQSTISSLLTSLNALATILSVWVISLFLQGNLYQILNYIGICGIFYSLIQFIILNKLNFNI